MGVPMTELSAAKTALRNNLRTVPRAIHSAAVSAHLAAWPPLTGRVMSYLAMEDEVDLGGILGTDTCQFLLPRITGEDELEARQYVPSELARHPFGFLEPTLAAPLVDPDELDVVLVPGRAFDRRGGRLGRGKGYYDRFLDRAPRGVVLVGVGVDATMVDSVPMGAHDRRVDWVATESGVRRVGQELQESTERFIASAVAAGIAAAPIRFPEGTRTSLDAARAIGCDLGAIAKSLVFLVDDDPVLVVCSGDRRVDEAKLCALFDASSAKPAPLSKVRDISGYAGGGTPAVGHVTSMPVAIDTSLGRYRWVWSAAGTPETVYPLSLERLVVATNGRLAQVAKEF
jgi:5,10-methenyltetrahydrofolate synthetase